MKLTPLLLSPLFLPSLATAKPKAGSSTSTTGQSPAPPLSPTSDSATITLRIPPAPPVLPNPLLLPPSTRATLTTLGRALAAPLSVAGTFVFANVTPGSYLVDVHCRTHAFAPLRLDVSAARQEAPAPADGGNADTGAVGGSDAAGGSPRVAAWETFRGNDWGNKGERVPVSEGGLVDLRVVGGKGYFMERSQFSVLSIFKNPIILLSLVSMALFFGMPKLVENMDPEMRAEWEERQKENPMNALMGAASGQNANPMASFDMAAFLAGSSSSSNKAEESNGAKGKGESRKKR